MTTITVPELVEMLVQAPCQRRYIMLVGTQGSGKSTIAKAIRDRGFKRLSYDKLAKRRPWLSESDLDKTFAAWLDKRLAKGCNIVDDNLNTEEKVRRQTLAQVRKCGYEVILLHLDMPLAVCQEQNLRRERQAPAWAVEKVWRRFNESGLPTSAEGTIIRLNKVDAEGDCEFERIESTYVAAAPPSQSWLLGILTWFGGLLRT